MASSLALVRDVYCTLIVVSLAVVLVRSQTCLPPATIQLNFGNCTFWYNETQMVDSWGILGGVINNATDPENLCLSPSTVVNTTMLMASEVCEGAAQLNGTTTAACLSRRGGVVNRSVLPTATTDGLAALNTGWVSLMKIDNSVAWQYAADATLELGDQSVTMVEGLVTQGEEHTASHLGLAESSTFLQALKNAGLIAARSWGFNAGSYGSNRFGSLVLGGYDETSVDGDFYTYDIAVPDLPLNQRPCPLQVTITSMNLTVRNSTSPLVVPANKATACLEIYDNLARLPENWLTTIKQQIATFIPTSEGPVDSSSYDTTLLDLEPGLIYPAKDSLDASLSVTINDGLTVAIPSSELVLPLRGLDPNGRRILNTNFSELQIYGQPAVENAVTLGKNFLSQLYLFVDYESMKFSLAQQNPKASTPLVKSSAPRPSTGMEPVEKGLIAVGTVLGVLILSLLGFVIYRKLKPHAKPAPESNSSHLRNGGRAGEPPPIQVPTVNSRVDRG